MSYAITIISQEIKIISLKDISLSQLLLCLSEISAAFGEGVIKALAAKFQEGFFFQL